MSSGGISSSSGLSLGQNSNSNATPSPTEPLPLPHPTSLDATPNNQAFFEAVASLSYAADILSNAAKAISSAVESLRLAGSHSDCANFYMQTGPPLSPENRTKDWLARSYSLNPAQTPNTELPLPSLLFENGGGIAGMSAVVHGNVNEANAGGLHHESSRTPEDHSETSSDSHSDVSQLDLTERGPAQPLTRNRESSNVDKATSLSATDIPREGDQLAERESVVPGTVVHLPQSPGSPQSQASSLDSSGGRITEPGAHVVEPRIQFNPSASNWSV
ncbi:hypothetical protein FRC10_001323 [Ceratobasidium sp. 414]|nr:hypothetical protein FRC10_001323 [Ceratobasidium sp. 414]